MADNTNLGQEVPADAFEPQLGPERLAEILAIIGIFIASSVAFSVLLPLPHGVLARGSYIQYAFGVVLGAIFLFGIGMIVIGWLLSDDPTRFHALGKTMMRVSHVVLVFAVALHMMAFTSTAPPNNND